MARNEKPQELNVIGLDGNTAAELGDKIQHELIDPFIGKYRVNIAERYFWQPRHVAGQYSALIYYTLEELPVEGDEGAVADKPAKKGKK